MPGIKIAKGAEVTFTPQNPISGDVYGPFQLEDDFHLSFNSQFSKLADLKSPALFKVASGIANSIFSGANIGSGQFKQFGFQVWDNTDPTMVSFTVGLYMKTDAKKDVIIPAKSLIKLSLPNDSTGGITGLVPPGPTVVEALAPGSKSTNALKLKIGGVEFPSVILTKAEPVVSRFSDDNQMPIYIKMQLDVTGIFTATVSEVSKFWP